MVSICNLFSATVAENGHCRTGLNCVQYPRSYLFRR